ncbi:MAG: glycosyltransferase family 1 protein [Patescibacteria group bacterium]|jgi:glycosyltransferase involved in cell wall biosynthesis
MRIGIDARFYGSFGKGLGRYTEKLITHLENLDEKNEYYIFLRKENWASFQSAKSNFRKVLADYRWYSLSEQIFLPLKIWSYHLDVMHFPHFNVPLLYFGRFVVTIHDLIITKYPTQRATTLGPILYKIKQFGYKVIIRSAVKKARKIITVSQYTKSELMKYFNITADKILITHEAVEPPSENFRSEEFVLSKYRIKKPFILFVGNVYPHKNIEGLLRAFKKILEKNQEYYLVLVGKDDYFYKKIKREVAFNDLEQKVIFTGFVTDEDLPGLYKNAKIYAFPSFCEGFGLPALEACSYGLPVAASNNSCLPEILGKAAVYFDPYNVDNMAEVISKLLNSESLIEKLRKLGIKKSKEYSWDRLAKSTLELYNSI